LPDVVLDQVINQLVKMSLAVVDLREVSVFIRHGVKHNS